MKRILSRLYTFLKYRELFFQLVSRDIKLRYRRSILGYFWSVLNPLLIMTIMSIVFSNLFRPNIKYFPIYILTGHMLFTFMANATTRSLTSVIENAALLKKVYVPKYIFTLAVVTSELVTLFFMMAALLIVIFANKVPLSPRIIFTLIPIIEQYVFCIGLGLFLAQATVFFRDVMYIWSVVTTAWLYVSAIFYPVDILPGWLHHIVTHYNPMYFYIALFRNFTIGSAGGGLELAIRGAVAAGLMLIVGHLSFSRSKNKFILYM